MVRAWRERPRVAFATLVAVVVIVGAAGAAGSVFAGGTDDSVLAAAQHRSGRAESASATLSGQLQTTRRDLSAARTEAATQHDAQRKANRKLKHARRKATHDARRIRHLKHQLHRARRAGR
jgi:chromosome segregation ATPase